LGKRKPWKPETRLLALATLTVGLTFVAPLVILIAFNKAPAEGALDWARLAAWSLCLAGLGAVFAQVGFEVRGRFGGVLVDERNRYSLSRLQMVLWTGIVLSTLYVLFVANAVRGTPAFESAEIALDPHLVALMGFSVATFVLSPMALSRKTDVPASVMSVEKANEELGTTQKLSTPVWAAGSVLMKGAPADARLSDLIRGEDVGDAATVDLPRTQMLLMTLVVVIGFTAAIVKRLATGPLLLDSLPNITETLLLLILVSHSGYLAGKLIPTTGSTSGATAEQTSRALVTSQHASSLVAEIKAELARMTASDARRPAFETHLAQAQTIASDAALLPGRLTAAGFKADEISLAEGRLETLRTTFRMLSQGRVQPVDPVNEETVAKVQQKLGSLGHSVVVSGVPDAATEAAISKWLTENGISRGSLHPHRMRYYEELADLI